MSVLTLPTRPNILMPLHSSSFQFFCFNESSFCRASRCHGTNEEHLDLMGLM
ncbi:hypothetical protein ACE6H2_017217 [Prunus campanulata]